MPKWQCGTCATALSPSAISPACTPTTGSSSGASFCITNITTAWPVWLCRVRLSPSSARALPAATAKPILSNNAASWAFMTASVSGSVHGERIHDLADAGHAFLVAGGDEGLDGGDLVLVEHHQLHHDGDLVAVALVLSGEGQQDRVVPCLLGFLRFLHRREVVVVVLDPLDGFFLGVFQLIALGRHGAHRQGDAGGSDDAHEATLVFGRLQLPAIGHHQGEFGLLLVREIHLGGGLRHAGNAHGQRKSGGKRRQDRFTKPDFPWISERLPGLWRGSAPRASASPSIRVG